MFGAIKKINYKKEAWIEIHVFLLVFQRSGEQLKRASFEALIEDGFAKNLSPSEVASLCATAYTTGVVSQLAVDVRRIILIQFKEYGLHFIKESLLAIATKKNPKYPPGFLPGTMMVGSVIATADTYFNQHKIREIFYENLITQIYSALQSDDEPTSNMSPTIKAMF